MVISKISTRNAFPYRAREKMCVRIFCGDDFKKKTARIFFFAYRVTFFLGNFGNLEMTRIRTPFFNFEMEISGWKMEIYPPKSWKFGNRVWKLRVLSFGNLEIVAI